MSEDKFERALSAYRAADYDSAETLLREILAAGPHVPAALWLSRLLWWGRGDGAAGSALLVAHFRDIFDIAQGRSRALPSRETTAWQATAAALVDGLFSHGAMLLRGLYQPEFLARFPGDALLPDVEKPIARLDQVSDELVEPLLLPIIAETVEALGLQLHDWRQGSWIRRVDPTLPGSIVPFHQDSLVCQARCANVWIPLMDCGPSTRRPGLELVARPLASLLPTMGGDETEYARMFMEIDEGDVVSGFEEDLWTPDFRVGDALMFLGTTIHRSALFAEEVRPRTSLELRFTDTN